MTIVLIGYMGSGKSTVAKTLAQVLGYRALDLDTFIETEVGMNIQSIFDSKGEVFFRKKETEALSEILKTKDAVIALGGGTPCYGKNLDIIKNQTDCKTIYLKSSIQSLTERLFTDKSTRPLISHLETKSELNEFIGKHLFERSKIYEQSDLTVITDKKRVKDIVESIIIQLF